MLFHILFVSLDMNKILFITAAIILSATRISGEIRPNSMKMEMKRDYYMQIIESDTVASTRRLASIDSLKILLPSNSTLYLRKIGKAYMSLGRFNEAEKVYSTLADQKGLPVNQKLNALYFCALTNISLGDYRKSLDYIFDIITVEKPDSLDYYDVETDFLLTNVYKLMGNPSKGKQFMASALEKIRRSKSDAVHRYNLQYRWHMEMANVYMDMGLYDKAFEEDRKAMEFNIDPETALLLEMDMARFYEINGEPHLAEEYYNKFINHSRNSIANATNHYYAWSNYALFLLNQKRYVESIEICLRMIPETRANGVKHVLTTLYEILAQDYEATGRPQEAYDALAQALSLRDSVMQWRMNRSLDGVTMSFEERLGEYNNRKLVTANRQKYILIIGLSLALILLITIALWLWRRNRLRKLKNNSLHAKIESNEVRHREVLRQQSDELDANRRELVELSLKMAETDNMLAQLSAVGKDKSRKPSVILSEINAMLKTRRASDNSWNIFRIQFEKLHPDFLRELYVRHPDLTSGEVKMCAFILMNLTSTQIAQLLNRSTRTVESMKYRLRKKLNLSGSVSTSAYLTTLRNTSVLSEQGPAK